VSHVGFGLDDLYAASSRLLDAHHIALAAGRDDIAAEITRAAAIIAGVVGLIVVSSKRCNQGHQDKEQ
jgi:hypothetical protein